MELIADFLLVAGAVGAGMYCAVLARRLNRFNDLEKGVGGAVAVLSAQVDDMTRILKTAQDSTGKSGEALDALTRRAEGAAQRLELMMASLHDLPDQAPANSLGADPVSRAAEPIQSAVPTPKSQDVPPARTDEVLFAENPPATAHPGSMPMFMRNPRLRTGTTI